MTAVRSVTGDGDRREPQGSADRAVVVVQRGGLAAAGEEQLVAPVAVAVERGDAAADEVLELAVVGVVDARRGGVVDEARRRVAPSTRDHRCTPPRSDGARAPTASDGDAQRCAIATSLDRHRRIEAQPSRPRDRVRSRRAPSEIGASVTNRGDGYSCERTVCTVAGVSLTMVLAAWGCRHEGERRDRGCGRRAVLAACGGDDDAPCGDDGGDDRRRRRPRRPRRRRHRCRWRGGDCTVGVSWNNYQEERWAKFDEPAIKAAVEAGGGTYISNDAKSSAETQANNVENLISQGADVLIILAQDGTAIKPSVASAIQNGVPVIAYDRLIEDKDALYLTFDNQLVGKLQAQAIFERVPKGNYVIIKGNKADANADFLRGRVRGGHRCRGEVRRHQDRRRDLHRQLGSGEGADPDGAVPHGRTTTRSTRCSRENDGMAGGVIAALEAQGLAGKVPVSGQDAEQAALNRVALGTQALTVWKDARLLGKTAGEAAVQLCKDQDASKVTGTEPFTTPGGVEVSLDLPDAAADHPGQPQRRDRRRLDHEGQRLQGRGRRLRHGLRLTDAANA